MFPKFTRHLHKNWNILKFYEIFSQIFNIFPEVIQN